MVNKLITLIFYATTFQGVKLPGSGSLNWDVILSWQAIRILAAVAGANKLPKLVGYPFSRRAAFIASIIAKYGALPKKRGGSPTA